MNNKRLNTQPFYGDALDRKELKAIVGGQSTNISPISIPEGFRPVQPRVTPIHTMSSR